MKKTLLFNRGMLKEWYDGLRARRLKQAGRLELVQITNDPPPYWFVLIRNFDQSDNGADRLGLKELTTGWGNGVWRFLDFEKAKAKFQQLSQLPIFVMEADLAEKLRIKRSEHMRRIRSSLSEHQHPNIG